MNKAPKTVKSAKKLSFRALQLSQNNQKFYFATIPVDELFPFCFVARRDEDPQLGFQRALNEQRAQDIANYLAVGTGSIASNIVLSAQPEARLSYNPRAGSISFQGDQSVFLVLDGQHRLWGYQKCSVRHRVPVAIYSGLSRAQEARLFIDINTTQRGVPAALLLDIKQIAEIEDSKEEILRKLFDRLNSDPQSSLKNKLSASKTLPNRISRVTFNRAIAPVLSSSLLTGMPPEKRYKLFLNYINAFDSELQDRYLLVRSAYFEAIFGIFDEVVRATIGAKGDAKQRSLQDTVQPIARLVVKTPAGSLPAKKTLADTMQATLRKNVHISDSML